MARRGHAEAGQQGACRGSGMLSEEPGWVRVSPASPGDMRQAAAGLLDPSMWVVLVAVEKEGPGAGRDSGKGTVTT